MKPPLPAPVPRAYREASDQVKSRGGFVVGDITICHKADRWNSQNLVLTAAVDIKLENAAWYYTDPKEKASNIKDHVAFCELAFQPPSRPADAC